MKMNNKGQSLVLFVLILPILLLIFFGVYSIGRMSLLKQELDGINNLAMDYALDVMEKDNVEDKISEVIVKNKDDIDKIEIEIKDNKVYILLEDKLDIKLSLLKNVFNAKSSYVGYIDNDKKVIERNK